MKRRRVKNTAAVPPPAGLPAAYGQTRLTLLDVDPFHIHAAWELTPRTRAAAEKNLSVRATAFVWVLRFHDERDGQTFDVPVNPDAGSWYVELWAADKTYHAELGPCSVSGDFVAVCRSNSVTTPPAAPVPAQQPQWLEVTGALENARRVAAPEREEERKSEAGERRPEVRSQRSEVRGQLAAGRGAAQDFPLAGVPSTEGVAPEAVPLENGPRAAADGAQVEPVLAAPLGAPTHDFPLAPPPHAGLITPVETLGALDIPQEVAAALTEKIAATSAPAVARALPASSDTVSSFSMGGAVSKAAIELELNAEVIVYGRAQPGQTLRVNGQPVSVNADGTFHVRWALPVAKP